MPIVNQIAGEVTDFSSHVEAEAPNNAPSRALVGVPITFIIFSTTAVILRVAGRHIRRSKLSWDDYTIFAALFCMYVMCISVVLEALYGGAGRHTQDVDPRRIENLFKILVVLQIFFGLSNGLVKCSLCLLYIRVLDVKHFRIVALSVMGICAAWGLMVILTAIFLCTPFEYNWDQSIPGHCANQKATFVSVGALDILTDLMIMSLPMRTLWHLQMKTATKIALSCIIGLGCFTIIISCLRIYTLLQLNFNDITYSNTYPFLWSCAEPATGILCASFPVAKPVFAELFENKSLQSAKRTASNGAGHTNRSWVDVQSGGAEHGGEQTIHMELSRMEQYVNGGQTTLTLENE